MSTLDGRIAKSAQSEMGVTWSALKESKDYGEDFIQLKIETVEAALFGEERTDTDLLLVDRLVIDYAGKQVALQLINAGIDYWSKQALTIGASGRTETKSFKDRSSDLVRLRGFLIEQIEELWPDVSALLPGRRTRRRSFIPLVAQAPGVLTPDPDQFERPFKAPEDVAGGQI